jgi:hypothetical protein
MAGRDELVDELTQSVLDHASRTGVINGDKPSLDDVMHFGKKGMKWGERTAAGKPTDDQIRGARARVDSEVRTINRQADKLNLSTGKQAQFEAKTYAKMMNKHLANPDRATALRMTKGEKYANTALAVGLPGFGTAAVGVGVAARVAQRKAVEKEVARRNAR